MGLDMYAYATKAKLKSEVDFTETNLKPEEVHYWRKHPNLHGWMHELYLSKGGDKHSDFNGDCVVLTEKDLNELESDIKDGSLPDTSGFFFGQTDGDEVQDDLDFVTKAREAITDGKTVYYTSWW
jgi:hypothetical protein